MRPLSVRAGQAYCLEIFRQSGHVLEGEGSRAEEGLASEPGFLLVQPLRARAQRPEDAVAFSDDTMEDVGHQ